MMEKVEMMEKVGVTLEGGKKMRRVRPAGWRCGAGAITIGQ